MKNLDYDYIIIGSGFGGSVSALRLTEKGYRVLVIEKGKKFSHEDFPKSNWNLKKWLWLPLLRFFGFFKISLFRHITVLSGVGVGGGSLVYANCLQIPLDGFFNSGSWNGLADWKSELDESYQKAKCMLGATPNPRLEKGDEILKEIGNEIGRSNHFAPTDVAIYFGNIKEKTDPYFEGKGPLREPCTFCGGCMTGCRYNAKNTLDKNYLYFAGKNGAKIIAESEVYLIDHVHQGNSNEGYEVFFKSTTSFFKGKSSYTAKSVIFAGGVMGTVRLLLKLKNTTLPYLSDKIGEDIRTNSESLLGVTTFNKSTVFSDGIAIGSILKTDDKTSIEPVRYSSGSGFWRLLMAPSVQGENFIIRIIRILMDLIKSPIQNIKGIFVRDWAAKTQILLFMQTVNSKLKFKNSIFGLRSVYSSGKLPSAFIPAAKELAGRFAKKSDGKTFALLTESIAGIPTTAHILGGAVMGKDHTEGVIDSNNKVFGYENLYVCDGSMISANPGVNPSLSIAAITERAMSKIPPKSIDS